MTAGTDGTAETAPGFGETGAGYAALSSADRRAVLEILIETKPGLPSYWTIG